MYKDRIFFIPNTVAPYGKMSEILSWPADDVDNQACR